MNCCLMQQQMMGVASGKEDKRTRSRNHSEKGQLNKNMVRLHVGFF